MEILLTPYRSTGPGTAATIGNILLQHAISVGASYAHKPVGLVLVNSMDILHGSDIDIADTTQAHHELQTRLSGAGNLEAPVTLTGQNYSLVRVAPGADAFRLYSKRFFVNDMSEQESMEYARTLRASIFDVLGIQRNDTTKDPRLAYGRVSQLTKDPKNLVDRLSTVPELTVRVGTYAVVRPFSPRRNRRSGSTRTSRR